MAIILPNIYQGFTPSKTQNIGNSLLVPSEDVVLTKLSNVRKKKTQSTSFFTNNSGSIATEYGLIAGIIAIAVFVFLPKVTHVMNEYASSSNCLMQVFDKDSDNLNSDCDKSGANGNSTKQGKTKKPNR